MSMTANFAVLDRVRREWASLTLARQFVVASGAVLIAGMLSIGLWVTQQIEAAVTTNAAAATALYIDSVIAPLLPEIREREDLPQVTRRALDETLSQGVLGRRIASFKIWKRSGVISYSSRPELIGKTFEPSENLERAWAGKVAVEFDSLDGDESALERAAGIPLIEVYSPIRAPWSGEVVAVAEFYEAAGALRQDLLRARLSTWLVVAVVTLSMSGLLSGIVMRGSGVIASQRRDLEDRIAELSRLLRENEQLRSRVQDASSRAAALNERYLKRISADLHDGPAQLLALASLRIGTPAEGETAAASKERDTIKGFLDEAMLEIRNICRGLTLPHIEAMDLRQLLSSVVASHEQRTSTSVALKLPEAARDLTPAEKICVFRFVQEGLSNAFRHGGGMGQSVEAAVRHGSLCVKVSDAGAGFAVDQESGDGLGLAGLRGRVESLGGDFGVASSPSGTCLEMTLRLSHEGTA